MKDKAAPKGPISAYIAFSMKERPRVEEELGSRRLVEVGKELGRRWAVLDPGARAAFLLQATRDRQRFEEEMRSYRTSKEELQVEAAARRLTMTHRPHIKGAAATEEEEGVDLALLYPEVVLTEVEEELGPTINLCSDEETISISSEDEESSIANETRNAGEEMLSKAEVNPKVVSSHTEDKSSFSIRLYLPECQT